MNEEIPVLPTLIYMYTFHDDEEEAYRITFEDEDDIRERFQDYKTIEELLSEETEELVTQDMNEIYGDFWDMFRYKQKCGEQVELKWVNVDM